MSIAIPVSYYGFQNHIKCKSAVCGALFFCHIETRRLCSPLLCLAFSFQQGSHCPCGHRALLAGASSHMFPSGANASDCIKHRKGERLIQVVCVKPGLQDHQGQVGLCTEQIWGSSVCQLLPSTTAPSSSPCFPASSSCPVGPDPRAHPVSAPQLTCCTVNHSGD